MLRRVTQRQVFAAQRRKPKTCSVPPLRKRSTHGLKCDRCFTNNLAQEGVVCVSAAEVHPKMSRMKNGRLTKAAQSVQPGADEGFELLAAELARIPHRIECSGLLLRQPAVANPTRHANSVGRLFNNCQLVTKRVTGFRKCLCMFPNFHASKLQPCSRKMTSEHPREHVNVRHGETPPDERQTTTDHTVCQRHLN